jgi:sarcosine oxidase
VSYSNLWEAGVEDIEADVIIVGAGSVGSMAAWQLSRAGVNVVAIDRFSIPGPFSAYAGESRLFRKVYAEGGHYTPVLARAQELWRELERESGLSLLKTPGAVTILDNDHPEVASLTAAATDHGLTFTRLAGDEARAAYPEHTIRDGDVAIFDPEGGYVRSEQAVVAALRLAAVNGARFLDNRAVTAVEGDGEGWVVVTDRERVTAPRVLVTTGTGAGRACDALGTHVAVLPQVLTWFPARDPAAFSRPDLPVFLRRSRDARFYGFPSSDGWSVKVAASVYLDEVESMKTPITWDPRHLDTVRSWVEEFLPGLVPDPVRVVVCADGYTTDETALLGTVPGMPGVVVAVGLSGHGFKMSPALANLATEILFSGESSIDIGFMNPARFLHEGSTLERLPL